MKVKLFSKSLTKSIHKTRRSHIKWMKEELNLMFLCIKGMFSIAYPRNDEEYRKLLGYLQAYDNSVQTIESEIIKRARDNCNMYKLSEERAKNKK